MVTMIKYHEVRPWKIKGCLMSFWVRGANWTHLIHFWYIYICMHSTPQEKKQVRFITALDTKFTKFYLFFVELLYI